MANYNFKSDIRLGESGEKTVLEYLVSKGAEFVSDNKDYKYDLKVRFKDKEVTYEVKTDVFCRPLRDTGNMFIEYNSRGKHSGITVTEADWFVTYYKNLKKMWFIKTSDLKKIISENQFPFTNYSGDEGSNTCGYLIPRNEFKELFKVKDV